MADSTVNVKAVDVQPAAVHNDADQTADPPGCLERLRRTRAAGWIRRILNPRPDPAEIRPPHPIMVTIREKELGKSVLSLGGAVAVALVISDNDKKAIITSQTVLGNLVLTGLSVGCMAIWNGIILRGKFRRAALVVEQVGIVMVLMSFNGMVASALPVGFVWVPILCGGLCLFPYFLIPAAFPAAAPDGTDGMIV